MNISAKILLILRLMLFVAPVIVFLSHVCVPLTLGHADQVSVVKTAGQSPDRAHHDHYLVVCDKVAIAANGLLINPAFTPFVDLSPAVSVSTSSSSPTIPHQLSAVPLNTLPIFLLQASLLI